MIQILFCGLLGHKNSQAITLYLVQFESIYAYQSLGLN